MPAGTFSPLTISSPSGTATVTFTPSEAGSGQIVVTLGGITSAPHAFTASAASADPTTVTLSAPSSAVVGVATRMTYTLDAPATSTVTITPTISGGGTGSPSSVTIAVGQSTAYQDVTWASAGTYTYDFTAAPSSLVRVGTPRSVTVSAQVGMGLVVHAGSTATLPYLGALFPLRSQVPSGQTLRSTDDANLRATILSQWDDGSAAVVVLSGSKALSSGQNTISLQLSASSDGTALATSDIAAVVSSIVVTVPGYGTATINSFGSPDRTWWANSRTICAQYSQALSSPGSTGLIAIAYIDAFAGGRARVRVAVENSSVNLTTPTLPAAADYTGATVEVNGSTIATVSNPTAGGGAYNAAKHEGTRAWLCEAWIGGDPGTVVTHDPEYLQQHPLFFGVDQASNQDLATLYSSDTYEPWGTGRHRRTGMGGGGDHASIGPLTKWDTQYLQSGDKNARQAVVTSALALLSYDINLRGSVHKRVPSKTDTGTRTRAAGTWPSIPGNASKGSIVDPGFEIAHHPSGPLMAFLCDPSPVFIELAQKVALWCGTYDVGDWGLGEWAETRGAAWTTRSYAHALFLTPTLPTAHAWRSESISALTSLITRLDAYRTAANNPLALIFDRSPSARVDQSAGASGWNHALWMHQWLAGELHRLESARLLSGASQTTLTTLTDWAFTSHVRQVNESTAGEWRFQTYMTPAGQTAGESANQNSLPTWGQMFDWYMADGPPALTGQWMTHGDSAKPNTYSTGYTAVAVARTDLDYPEHFWASIVGALERNVSGATNAWWKLNAFVSALPAWRAGFAADPREGVYPRNWARGSAPTWVPAVGKFGHAGTGTYALPSSVDPGHPASASNTQGFAAIWDVWCGGAYAPLLGPLGSLLMWGGGNRAHDGNGMVQYDIAARRFRMLTLPSPYTSAGDDNGINNAVDINGGWVVDGTPCPTHTYGTPTWLPPEAGGGTLGSWVHLTRHQNRLNITTVTLWRLDLSTLAWSRWVIFPSGTVWTEYAGMTYDARRKGLWIMMPVPGVGGSTGLQKLYFASYVTNTVTQVTMAGPATSGGSIITGSTPDGFYMVMPEYHEPRDCIVIPKSGPAKEIICIDLTNATAGNAQAHKITYSGTACPSLWSFPDGSGGTYGLSYANYGSADKLVSCPRDGALWSMNMHAGTTSAQMYKLAPPTGALTDSWTWTNQTLTANSGESVALRNSTLATVRDKTFMGRLRYVPALDGFIFSDAHNLNAQLLRPTFS